MKEKCVVCNKETDVDINTHVDYRLFYVDGAGQTCRECWNGIAPTKDISALKEELNYWKNEFVPDNNSGKMLREVKIKKLKEELRGA